MRIRGLLLLCLFASVASGQGIAQSAPGSAAPAVVGTWEGESKCTVPSSPCHDEHVVYQIASASGDQGTLKLDAYKVVNGEQEFMGTLSCQYAKRLLSCSGRTDHQDLWEFAVTATTMQGTLRIGTEKQLYRKIQVQKKPSA
ncbi:MAG: hypothetical protein LAO24_24345 [Acidobacteriia bacterium]|nr:hypothetical protein [Terriglobia bacterium]